MYFPELNPYESGQATKLLENLRQWLNVVERSPAPNQYNQALDAVNEAISETRKYLKVRREGQERNSEIESKLEKLWFGASSAIRPYDETLADLCMVKGHGWADEK